MTIYCSDMQTVAAEIENLAGEYTKIKVERDGDMYAVTFTNEKKEAES